ncbi:MAG: hypothetical protein PHU56_01795 [Candidatus Pacebacteria bacterium]|nr:hypothetical protein [Candidatus Paceibacterota bacterium]
MIMELGDKKRYIFIFFILSAFVIVAFLGIFSLRYYLGKQAKETPPSVNITATSSVSCLAADCSNTDDWPIYTNERFHYSIKYPSGWAASDGPADPNCAENNNIPCGPQVHVEFAYNQNGLVIIQILHNRDNLSLKDWVKNRGTGVVVDVDKECKAVSTNGVDGLKWKDDYLFRSGEDVIDIGASGLTWVMNLSDDSFIDEMKRILPASKMPSEFYSTLPEKSYQKDLSEQKAGVLQEKFLDEIVSTFRVLD